MTRIPIDDDNDTNDAPVAGEDAPAGDRAGQAAGGGDAGELQRLREERDLNHDRWIRAKADAENMRKRLEGEFDQRVQYANASLIKSLLPVIDNFERALSVDPAKTDAVALLKGMQIVHDQWISVLKQQKVDEIAPERGTPFDPQQHEALMQQESEFKTPTVTQLLQKGYALQGRVLRPAQVAVSRSQ